MKTNRRRHDDETQLLFEHERTLRQAFHDNNWNAVKEVLDELRRELKTQQEAGIASSRGLDHYLQVAMAWITTHLGWKAHEDSFRSTVSLFLPNLQAVLVKPSLIAPDKARAPQPTISTDKGSPNFGYRRAIGHTGLVMVSEKILYCQPIVTQCGQYIALESGKSKAALCIPLRGKFSELRQEFAREQSFPNIVTCSLHGHCESTSDQVGLLKEDKIVLNIECASDFLSSKKALDLMSEEAFSEVIQEIIGTLANYQKQRDVHRALEHSSTLLALATNTLRPRDAYRALLREISTACDGADVTLHLQDLFDKENEHRCSLFVTGIGKNFRDFLINERIGLKSGQIGWAFTESSDPPPGMSESGFDLSIRGDAGAQTVKAHFVAGDEITKSLAGENEIPFKQLMPNTFLNVTVPIYFHDIMMGVLNLEWDKKTLQDNAGLGPLPQTIDSQARGELQEYLSKCLPVVYRMADYLSLVIDYFDDVQNLVGRPKPEQLDDPEFIDRLERDGALRKVMRYYMKRGMAKARELAQARRLRPSDQEENDKFHAEAACLEDLVDAMGYFLAHISNLRILVSVRRKMLDNEGHWILRHQVSHWLEGDKADQDAKESPIRIDDQESVLAASGRHGVPLFGMIENKQGVEEDGVPKRQLRLDGRCQELISDSRFPERPSTTVPYRRAGRNPRYEVGVPLVFGRSMLGTFDFEQFEQEKPTLGPKPLQDHDLCAHLEWSRAISFLLAYLDDAIFPIGQSDAGQKAFNRFQALTAQLIAEVPVDEVQFLAIATDSFADIFSLREARVKKLRQASPETKNSLAAELQVDTGAPSQPHEKVAPEPPQIDLLRFRGVVENALSWEKDEWNNRALLRSHSELRPRSTVTSMMTAYHSLLLNLRQDPEDVGFKVAIESIILDLARAREELTDPSRDAGEAILNLFVFLHKSLRRNLAGLAEETEGGLKASEYAWFLHVRRFEPGEVLASFNCGIEARDQEKQVLAYCYTSEMKTIVERIQEVTKDMTSAELLKAIEVVLKERSKDDQIQDLMLRVKSALPVHSPLSEQDLIRALTICLARRRVIRSGDLSFTLFVANAEGALVVVPEINLSPMRSERGHLWFWKSTYTVLGIPFMFDNQCVAVLNIFRRRDSNRDMKFFRIEERDKAKELVNYVSALLQELVNTEQVKPIDKVRLRDGLEPLVTSLIARAERDEAKLIVVQTPFATSAASFQALWDVIFADPSAPAQLRNAVRFPEDERSIQNRNVVMRIGKKINEPEKLGADIGLLARQAKHVFLFTARRQDLTQLSSDPVYARHVPIGDVDEILLNEDPQQEELYRDWLLGKAIVSSEGDQLKMLFRRADANQEWTYQAFTQWLLDRRRDSETADYYDLIDLLRASSWRPDDKTLALKRWRVDA